MNHKELRHILAACAKERLIPRAAYLALKSALTPQNHEALHTRSLETHLGALLGHIDVLQGGSTITCQTDFYKAV